MLRRLEDNLESVGLAVAGVNRQRGADIDQQSADPERWAAAILPRPACQHSQVLRNLGLGDPFGFAWTGVPVEHGHGKTGALDHHRSAAVLDRDHAEMVDDSGAVAAMDDGDRPAADANHGRAGSDGSRTLMTDEAADIAKCAFDEGRRHMAAMGGRVEDKFVDQDIGVRPDAQRGLVYEKQLDRSGRCGLDALFVNDARSDVQRDQLGTGRGALRQRIDGCRGADTLRQRWQRCQRGAGQENSNGLSRSHGVPLKFDRRPDRDRQVPHREYRQI